VATILINIKRYYYFLKEWGKKLGFTLSKQKVDKHQFPKIYQKVKKHDKKKSYNKHQGNRIAKAAVGSKPGIAELRGVSVLLRQNDKITPNSIGFMDGRILFSIIFFSQKPVLFLKH